MFANAWLIHGFGQTMAQLSRVLDEVLTARVVDETGLSGRFDFTVEWGERRTVPRPPNEQSPDDIAALITAFRERLGLKLESERKPVDVVVVEHIEQPDSD